MTQYIHIQLAYTPGSWHWMLRTLLFDQWAVIRVCSVKHGLVTVPLGGFLSSMQNERWPNKQVNFPWTPCFGVGVSKLWEEWRLCGGLLDEQQRGALANGHPLSDEASRWRKFPNPSLNNLRTREDVPTALHWCFLPMLWVALPPSA